jgi:hypothetical protein
MTEDTAKELVKVLVSLVQELRGINIALRETKK